MLCREYGSIFAQLEFSESEEIFQTTGCRKPCKYKKYSFLGEPYPSAFKSEHFIFSLWAVSYKTKVKTEELIYPSSSLVAEFGGILSLFLGFSFISVWDNFRLFRQLLSTLKKILCPQKVSNKTNVETANCSVQDPLY